MFENRAPRKIFGPKRDEIIVDCRKLHNENLHTLYSSSNIIIILKSRKITWPVYVARIGRRKMHTLFCREYRKERGRLGEIHTDEEVMLKWFLGK
jgi:hypothetical protein